MKASGALQVHSSQQVVVSKRSCEVSSRIGPGCLVEKTRPSLSQHIASCVKHDAILDPWMEEAASALQP